MIKVLTQKRGKWKKQQWWCWWLTKDYWIVHLRVSGIYSGKEVVNSFCSDSFCSESDISEVIYFLFFFLFLLNRKKITHNCSLNALWWTKRYQPWTTVFPKEWELGRIVTKSFFSHSFLKCQYTVSFDHRSKIIIRQFPLSIYVL